MEKTEKKHILVDLDGTLLEAPPRIFLFANIILMMQRFGPVFGWRNLFRGIYRPLMKTLKNSPRSGLTNFQILTQEMKNHSRCSEEEMTTALWKFYRSDFPRLKFLCAAIPQAKEKLNEFANRGHKIYLVTNPIWPEESVLRRLEWAGISADIFSGMTHSQNSSACKPKLEYYEEAFRRWGLMPDNCVMIGDSETKDGPARELGVKVVLLPARKKAEFWSLLSLR